MNLLKGNINFTNEIIDTMRSRDDLKGNDTLIDLLKALKEMEPKLFELISDTDNENILNLCLMVNEDMQKTFDRFKIIKDGGKAEPFTPGECRMMVHYLEPNHTYHQASPSP